jgi:hypothetical protein
MKCFIYIYNRLSQSILIGFSIIVNGEEQGYKLFAAFEVPGFELFVKGLSITGTHDKAYASEHRQLAIICSLSRLILDE